MPSHELDGDGNGWLPEHPCIAGIVNVTPDSFSDGGRFADPKHAAAHALELVGEGAHLLDIGGESTRPGAAPVSVQEELDRVIPVIESLAARVEVPLSVDTSRPEVMRAAVAAGAQWINDTRALQREGALQAAAETGAVVCLMHMQGRPADMQDAPRYEDVVTEVHAFLADRLEACRQAGIAPERVLVDPGFGFGKTVQHNLQLLAGLDRFTTLGAGVLVGLSRKSVLGAITGRSVDRRQVASAVAAVLAVQQGARVVRVHDVAATRDALAVLDAVGATSS